MTYRRTLCAVSALIFASPAFAGPTAPSYVPDLVPPNPVAGECYARVEIPAQYEATAQTVMTRDAYQRVLVQQPKLETTTQRVMVKEPSVRYVVRQPTYRTVTDKVMTRPGYDKLSVSEPQFRPMTETLQSGQSRLVWKRGNPAKLRAQGYKIHSMADAGQGGRGYSSTSDYGRTGGQRCGNACEIWCLVEEPGQSVTVTRNILSQPGQVHRTPVAPVYQSITRQVVADPGGVDEIPVPGEYRTIQVDRLVHPGGTATVNVPAEYGQVQGRRLVSDSRYEWRRIACQPKTTVSTRTNSAPHISVHPTTMQSTTQSHHVAPLQTHSSIRTISSSQTHKNYSAPKTVYSSSGPIYTQGSSPVTVELSSPYPDRSYSGPAYGHSDVKQSSDGHHQVHRVRR